MNRHKKFLNTTKFLVLCGLLVGSSAFAQDGWPYYRATRGTSFMRSLLKLTRIASQNWFSVEAAASIMGLILGGIMYAHLKDWLFVLSSGFIFAVVILSFWFPSEMPKTESGDERISI